MSISDEGKAFRSALGTFATGVTIVTSADQDGAPVGVTASSFNSVSMDPPLVLWSLSKSALSSNIFCSSGHFAIHVLLASQEQLSNSFATSGADKFANVNWQPGALGSPLIDDYAALFQCKTLHQYEGGDHVILVGEVIEFDQKDKAPLLFHGGRYAESRPKISGETQDNVDITEGRFTEDFLLYLVSRAHFQTSRPTRRKLEALGLSQSEYLTLSILSMNTSASAAQVADRLDHTGVAPSTSDLDNMVQRGLLIAEGGEYELAPTGREYLIETLSVAKAFEDDLMDQFTASELADAKHVLKKLIKLTGDDIPGLWD